MITFCIISCLTNWNVSLNTISLPKSKGRLLTHIQLVVYQDSQGLFCHFINIYEASSFQPGLDFRNSCKNLKMSSLMLFCAGRSFWRKQRKTKIAAGFITQLWWLTLKGKAVMSLSRQHFQWSLQSMKQTNKQKNKACTALTPSVIILSLRPSLRKKFLICCSLCFTKFECLTSTYGEAL